MLSYFDRHSQSQKTTKFYSLQKNTLKRVIDDLIFSWKIAVHCIR